jgi:20S proteasome alpha/beta subunit
MVLLTELHEFAGIQVVGHFGGRRKMLAYTFLGRSNDITYRMTVGIAIKCTDGLIVASDSLATFGRGVPVSKMISKIHVIEHPALLFPVVIVGAGATAFVDKFLDLIRRDMIVQAQAALGQARRNSNVKLDIVDFADRVCETTAGVLYKEYVIDRQNFFGVPIPSQFSLGLIVAGATKDGELRAFFVHQDGLTENIPDYGTIGTGAAYAELFLRELVTEPKTKAHTKDAATLAVYAVKGAEIMDPNVGGSAHVKILSVKTGDQGAKTLDVVDFEDAEKYDKIAAEKMEQILRDMGKKMRTFIQAEEKKP